MILPERMRDIVTTVSMMPESNMTMPKKPALV
jgi:hypothetical protein